MAKSSVKPARKPDRTALRGLPPRTAAMLGDAARLVDRQDYAGAERALTGALVLAGTHPETVRLHGLIHHRRGQLAQAEAIYRQGLVAHPDDATLLSQLGDLKGDMGDLDSAYALLRRASELASGDASVWLRLGILLDKQAQHDEALAVGRRIVEIEPNHHLGRLLIARNLHALGRIEDTAAEYRRMIAIGGERAYQAWFSLVDLKTIRLDAPEVAALEKLAQDSRLGAHALAPLNFALGKVCEDAARYPAAFAAFSRANSITRRGIQWDAGAFSRQVDETMRIFSAPVARAPAGGSEVIFVLGMPRSSTTLVEQILAAHSEVEGASELPDLGAVLNQESARRGVGFPHWVAQSSPDDWQRLGREYLARTARWRVQRPRFTDKLPNNWLLIGVALAMLPDARIIDCRRDPMETCWSCYKQLFAPGLVRYAYDLRELGLYWRDYDRLCRFWLERYPTRVRAQSYEGLLAEPETEIRALLEFCELPFEESSLRFHEARRGVRTVSSGQVRQPLRRDTARTSNYGELLAPLRNALNGASA
ncbi:MAG: sulfotransferase [Rhodanobacteraceae bacterium]